MTTRPGNRALGMWAHHRTKRGCNLVRIVRTDGYELTFTDHDRAMTFEGATYTPVSFAGMSAERRESALRSGNQELYGIIDGTFVMLPDLLGYRYRDAEVFHVITDWSMPWLVVARHRKFIRNVTWNGSAFVATIEGRSQVLSRPAGGDLSGSWIAKCPKKLGSTEGDHPCLADISVWTKAATHVDAVTGRLDFSFSATGFGGSYADDEYRDGEVEWTAGDNVGHISTIVGFTQANRGMKILRPTPFPVQVGDTAIVRVGCDGLASTCKVKFSNFVNFGGDPLAPSASQIVEPAVGQ